MNQLFLDTSYVIALETNDDQYHNVALKHWQKLIQSPFQLVTTSYIFTEIVTFFNSRRRHAKAVEVGQPLLTSQRVEMIQVDINIFEQAWQLFQQYNDKSYSLTDCVSFVVMQQKSLNNALTFDKHFSQAGFNQLPKLY